MSEIEFWTSELGTVTGTAADAYAKSFREIPDGTTALAKIDKFVLSEREYKHYQIDWLLTDGDFKGQHVFHKIKAIDPDPRDKNPAKTRHRALNMLMFIYKQFNAKPKSNLAPTEADLGVFIGKQAGIKIQLTEPNEDGRQYSWVSEVHQSEGFVCETGKVVEVVHTQPRDDSAFARNKPKEDPGLEGLPF